MSRDLRATEGVEPLGEARPVILIVDDDPGLRESFRLILEDDYELVEAADGRQALEIVRSSEVDLVLLDIRLPEMDGIEVLERIKTLDDQVEVVLGTAVKTVRTAVAAMKLGAFATSPSRSRKTISSPSSAGPWTSARSSARWSSSGRSWRGARSSARSWAITPRCRSSSA